MGRAPSTAGFLLFAFTGCSPGSESSLVQGEVLNHRSGEPIVGANVVLERRGWGRSDPGGYLVWDKRYRAQAITDERGAFSIEAPGPTLLVGRGPGMLSMQADGLHGLRTQAARGAWVSLHTIPDHEEGSPGGTATLGYLTDGRKFGWSFVENRAVTEPERADLLVQSIVPSEARVTLAVPPGGGLLFIPLADQEVGAPAEGHLLRFIDEPPSDLETEELTLGPEPGTLFLLTTDRRYAKLGWDPTNAFSVGGHVPTLEVTATDQIWLPFVYRPTPGRFVPFQPPVRPVDPLFAAAAAEINDCADAGEGGSDTCRGSRRYILELRGSDGSVLDHQVVTLEPGEPKGIPVTPRGIASRWRYEDLLLDYDDQGLPRINLHVRGSRFSSHFLPKWVTQRLETEFHFDAYIETSSTPISLTLAVRQEG